VTTLYLRDVPSRSEHTIQRPCSICVSAGQRDFCSGFDSRQLHINAQVKDAIPSLGLSASTSMSVIAPHADAQGPISESRTS
jgi:hypothetical protein